MSWTRFLCSFIQPVLVGIFFSTDRIDGTKKRVAGQAANRAQSLGSLGRVARGTGASDGLPESVAKSCSMRGGPPCIGWLTDRWKSECDLEDGSCGVGQWL